MPVQESQINHWMELYEQMPVIIRWLLLVLSAGLISLIHVIWRRHQERLAAIETAHRDFATKSDVREIKEAVDGVHDRIDQLFLHLGVSHPRGRR